MIDTFTDILLKIYRKYNKMPHGWRVFVSRDKDGFPTILFYSPDEVWELKLDSLYKQKPIGVGGKLKVKEESRKFSEMPDYGFRPLSSEEFNELMSSVRDRERLNKFLNTLLSREPKPMNELRGSGLLHGPVVYTPGIPLISKKQAELDEKLRVNLKKLLADRGVTKLYV